MDELKSKATELATDGVRATGIPASLAVIFIVVSIVLVGALGRSFGNDLIGHVHNISLQSAANAAYSDCNEIRYARGNADNEVCILERISHIR